MDIYLNWHNDEKSMLLPINPESYDAKITNNNTTEYIHGLGKINLKGKGGLYETTISSIFPGQKYSFQHGDFHDPYDYYCKKLKALAEKNETVHLIITETDINMYCTIEEFTHGESSGSRDVKYSISLMQYREPEAAKRVSTKKKNATVTWKKGDTWPKVTKKVKGSSSTWKTVRKNNAATIRKAKKKYPKKKEVDALIGSKVIVK